MFSRDRIALFIDGANMHATGKALGFELDYAKVLSHFATRGDMIIAKYYTALYEPGSAADAAVGVRSLVGWLSYNGFVVETKIAKVFPNVNGLVKVKGNMDGEIIIDIIEMRTHIDHVYLFTGDGDFTCLIAYLQRVGVKTTVVSTIQTNPPMLADELRRRVSNFIDLNSIRSKIERT